MTVADKCVTSKSYTDAEDLWYSTRRVYQGRLPRILPMGIRYVLADRERKALFDSGFYSYFFANANWLTMRVGSQTMVEYAAAHTGPDVIVSVPPIRSHTCMATAEETSFQSSRENPYYHADGSHIGNGESGNPTGDPANRFRDSEGKPRPVMWETPDRQNWAVPILPDTIYSYWVSAQLYNWRNNTIAGQSTVKSLLASGVLPNAIFCDWEDHAWYLYGGPEPSLKSMYATDPRFASDSNQRYWELMTRMIDARLAAMRTQCPWAVEDKSGIFDVSNVIHYASETFDAPFLRRCGRPVVLLSCYPSQGAVIGLLQIGIRAAEWIRRGVHCFHGWTNAGTGCLSDVRNPSDHAVSISECIAITKMLLTLGAGDVNIWTSPDCPLHCYWSVPIALSEMEEYSEFMRHGETHIPDSSRRLDAPDYTGRPSAIYDVGNPNRFVACRTYRGRSMFCGVSMDGTAGTVQVEIPGGRVVPVKYGPFGEISIW